MADQAQQVVVPVKSAWSSRINQIAVGVFGLAVPLAALAPILPAPWNGRVLAAVSVIGAFSLWYYRTFGTASVTPSSLPTSTVPTPATVTTAMRNAGIPEDQITNALNNAQLIKQ